MAVVPNDDRSDGGHTSGVTDRTVGLALFLPVPIVLWLFTAAPLGPLPSVLLGVIAMATHRFYARPWALARANRRCLWCGGAAGEGPRIELHEPGGPSVWRACSPSHASRLGHALEAARALAPLLRVGILGGLCAFLVGVLLAASGTLVPVTHADAVALFKACVAVAVVPFGWLSPYFRSRLAEPARVPFPVHIQALIGTWSVLWLFRVVGIVWLVQAIRHALLPP